MACRYPCRRLVRIIEREKAVCLSSNIIGPTSAREEPFTIPARAGFVKAVLIGERLVQVQFLSQVGLSVAILVLPDNICKIRIFSNSSTFVIHRTRRPVSNARSTGPINCPGFLEDKIPFNSKFTGRRIPYQFSAYGQITRHIYTAVVGNISSNVHIPINRHQTTVAVGQIPAHVYNGIPLYLVTNRRSALVFQVYPNIQVTSHTCGAFVFDRTRHQEFPFNRRLVSLEIAIYDTRFQFIRSNELVRLPLESLVEIDSGHHLGNPHLIKPVHIENSDFIMFCATTRRTRRKNLQFEVMCRTGIYASQPDVVILPRLQPGDKPVIQLNLFPCLLILPDHGTNVVCMEGHPCASIFDPRHGTLVRFLLLQTGA